MVRGVTYPCLILSPHKNTHCHGMCAAMPACSCCLVSGAWVLTWLPDTLLLMLFVLPCCLFLPAQKEVVILRWEWG